MEACVFCKQPLSGKPTVTLTAKGSAGVAKASAERDSNIALQPGDVVHIDCRKDWCNPKSIERFKRKRDADPSTCNKRTLRSDEPNFSFKENCLFCGISDRYEGKKKQFELMRVRTLVIDDTLLSICDKRKDEWAEQVRRRILHARELHSSETVYHTTCSSNFRTGKNMPQCFVDSEVATKKPRVSLGRPENSVRVDAFLKVTRYLQENDEEQTTIYDLIDKMKEFLEGTNVEPYSFRFMKEKLLEHFGDEIIITEISGSKNVVTFKRTASAILNDFYRQPKGNDSEAEKLRLIEAAGNLIKSDIKSVVQSKDVYPTSLSMSNVAEAAAFLPGSLQHLLNVMFVGQKKDIRVCSLGQAVMQAVRPRVLLAPVQLGLGVQMHSHFQSRFLIDTLNELGFSVSYSEVQKYERSATMSNRTDIPGFTNGHFIQYAADNVDHNVRTLDGHGTFHGMGIVVNVTPRIQRTSIVKRITVTADDIAKVGRIDIRHYAAPRNGMKKLTYEEFSLPCEPEQFPKVDLLWKISSKVCAQRPAWSGLMQMISKGEHPGQASVMPLPMIDLNPSDLSCVYSTLYFIRDHAERYNVTPVVTFDQPLWWKATTILENELENSPLRSIVLRLGGFHTLMSFLGSIGRLMEGTGLRDILETVFARNTVCHMLSGKAVARALRGHFLTDSALSSVLIDQVLGLLAEDSCENILDEEDDNMSVLSVDSIEDMNETLSENAHTEGFTVENPVLKFVQTSMEGLLKGEVTELEIESSETMAEVQESIAKIAERKDQRTSQLWLMYMRMVDIVRNFIRSERTGDWMLNLQCMNAMLPYLAASGHNLYTKSLFVYLQKMANLETTNHDLFLKFMDGYSVVRRSDRFWAGLSPDLVIEQVLMRSLKTTGGLTRGRGMTELQRHIWCLSRPICTEVNNAMQQLTNVVYETSEQHKDLSASRKERDASDVAKLITHLNGKSPFKEASSLYNVITGVEASQEVNVDKAEEIGSKIVKEMIGEPVLSYTFKKKNQVVTMDSRSKVKIGDEEIHIDPLLLFQRLIFAGTQRNILQDALSYELCGYAPSLFERRSVLLKANKPALANAIWAKAPDVSDESLEGLARNRCVHVLDGGALLHRVFWNVGETYDEICSKYVSYVKGKYGLAVVVFDGYKSGPNTKDSTHSKRTGTASRTVSFTSEMRLQTEKGDFLSNQTNKQRFIDLLGSHLERANCEVYHAKDDADLLIVTTTLHAAQTHDTILVGDDTDLIVLLLYHSTADCPNKIFFKPEPKGGSPVRYMDIAEVRGTLGEEVCRNILFVHAILGCDTTSRLFGFGKATALSLIQKDKCFREQAAVFNSSSSSATEISEAGEKALMCLYRAKHAENLNALRYQKFQELLRTSKKAVHPKSLPPTSATAKNHSLRTYHQVQTWKGFELNAEDWGWKVSEGKMTPVQNDLEPAPKELLEFVRCTCKAGCSTMRCGCRRIGLACTVACGECKGICENASEIDENDLDKV